ncbi:stage VI sporulation protein D [Peribacillus simplex]|uniref:stage VI sporulation protein D n=1 Tax=Peribacillus simplex TaxID=1478 RepID=UPI00298DC96B|nr:stage VI sporulation protein D [Peribacillus simplex]MDW7613541.1 stage VI sporulation protein D [Peribacillus simplex]
MSQENESYLRFSLEESVWFQKGQEVAELFSISLDPNVTIQESDQYVFIRGSLDLCGEYKDSQNGEEEEFSQTFLPKAVQKVERHPDGLTEFTHRFPVDITIPNNRIASLEEIDVSIQSFDYAMPEHNCLKLQADLLITGIYNDSYVEERFDTEQEVGETEEQEETDGENESYIPYAAAVPPIPDFQPVFRDEQEEELYTPFSAEAKRVSEANEEEEEEPIYLSDQHGVPVFEIPVSPYPEEEEWETEVHRQEEVNFSISDQPDSEEVPMSSMEEEKQEENVSRQETVEKVETPRKTLMEEEAVEEPNHVINHISVPVENSPVSNSENEDVIRQEEAEAAAGPILNEHAKMEHEEEANSSSISDLFKKKERPAPPAKEVKNFKGRKQAVERDDKETAEHDEKQLSIMDLFGRKQEEELVRMKVCIVQQGETLDDLAQRYDVTVQSILFSNELESNQNVHEGQVIYIPKAVAYKN